MEARATNVVAIKSLRLTGSKPRRRTGELPQPNTPPSIDPGRLIRDRTRAQMKTRVH